MFNVRNLSVLGYAQGFTLWHYKIIDINISLVIEDNYFIDGANMFSVGDMIMLSGRNEAKIVFVNYNNDDKISVGELS